MRVRKKHGYMIDVATAAVYILVLGTGRTKQVEWRDMAASRIGLPGAQAPRTANEEGVMG